VSTRKTLMRNIVASMLVIAGSDATFAADVPPANDAAPTKEMREKMATLHEQMAACLRSDKSIADCRGEMAKNCGDMMGEKGCPMMDGMHHHMMRDQSSVTPKRK
jgi:hypothetical protein